MNWMPIHEGFLVFMALFNEHIVPDANNIGHERDHVGGFPDSLAMRAVYPLRHGRGAGPPRGI